ncbi:MAG: helix-turn-helix transcriptional regulator [Alphaproteobacteria bacterium]|nr:helix-turn-helix transcriptional regulator [Alphaproteobacteria bacterium]
MIKNNMQKKKLLEFDQQKNAWLNAICAPLFKNTPITSFAYMEFYNEKEFFHMCTDVAWSEVFLGFESNGAAFEKEVSIAFNTPKFHSYYWPLEGDDHVMSCLKKHNIWHGLSIYKKDNGFLRVFCFSGDLNSSLIYNFYLNKMNILEEFIWHFESQSRIILSDENTRDNRSSFSIPMNLSYNDMFSNKDDPKFNAQKIPFYIDGTRQFITPREKDCLALFSEGYSAKSIAQNLGVSHRTIEKTIEYLKLKTKQTNKSNLINLWKLNKIF